MSCAKSTYARLGRRCKCLVGAIMFSGLLGTAVRAQGGPPYITDDPDTPGAHNWEINTAVIGAQSHRHWDLAAPDLDINYGWGEHVQLKVDVNWASTLASDGRLISGFGATDFGVKWRLVDQDKSGFALSVYPQLLTNLLPSSAARGLTTDDREFFLPAEFSTEYGAFQFDAELGRNFVQRGPDAWIGGVIDDRQTFGGARGGGTGIRVQFQRSSELSILFRHSVSKGIMRSCLLDAPLTAGNSHRLMGA